MEDAKVLIEGAQILFVAFELCLVGANRAEIVGAMQSVGLTL